MTASRVDNNQGIIVQTFRNLNCTVAHLHDIGRGVPDLLVGYRGYNLLVEVKTAEGALRPIQKAWHKNWLGHVTVIRTPQEAIELIRTITN